MTHGLHPCLYTTPGLVLSRVGLQAILLARLCVLDRQSVDPPSLSPAAEQLTSHGFDAFHSRKGCRSRSTSFRAR